MTTARDVLTSAQADLEQLEHDLAQLRSTLAAHDEQLTVARRGGESPERLAELGARAASLRLLVADQTADVLTAQAHVERASLAHERAEVLERVSAAADVITSRREALDRAMLQVPRALAKALEPAVIAARDWRAAFEMVPTAVGELARLAALEAGTEPPARPLESDAAWSAFFEALAEAGIPAEALSEHPHQWAREQLASGSGARLPWSPTVHHVELGQDLAQALTPDPTREPLAPSAWPIDAAPELARRVALAVLRGRVTSGASS